MSINKLVCITCLPEYHKGELELICKEQEHYYHNNNNRVLKNTRSRDYVRSLLWNLKTTLNLFPTMAFAKCIILNSVSKWCSVSISQDAGSYHTALCRAKTKQAGHKTTPESLQKAVVFMGREASQNELSSTLPVVRPFWKGMVSLLSHSNSVEKANVLEQ